MQMTRREFLTGIAASGLSGCVGPRRGDAETIRIVHLGDPQLGFSLPIDTEESYQACLDRFLKMVAKANALRPDLVVVSGDMCHHAADLERDWPSLLRRFDRPVVFTPGNHDLGNAVTAENLARFRKVFGLDRDAFEIKGWFFIVGNSQFWRPTKLKTEQAEYERWVTARLEEARGFNGCVVGVTHIPPFVRAVDENDSYNNYPKSGRAQRIARYRAVGLDMYLAGHTHRYGRRKVDGLTILNSETTSRNFDRRPFGGRILTLNPDRSYSYQFISVF